MKENSIEERVSTRDDNERGDNRQFGRVVFIIIRKISRSFAMCQPNS